MFQVEDEPVETIHVYVVREGQLRPSLVPVLLAFLALVFLIAYGVLIPYQQPEQREAIHVPFVLLPPKTFSAEVKIIPTGVKTYPAKSAHGTLTFTNGSILSEELPKGMIFTGKNSVEVVTDEAVVVPAGNANSFGITTVSAHTVKSGTKGNIPSFAINQVEGTSLFIRNLQPFIGGMDAYTITFITPQDKQDALSRARVTLMQQIISGLLSHPCAERITGTTSIQVTWTCQFVTYETPYRPGMKVLHVEVVGKAIILNIAFVARPRIFVGK